MRRFLSALALFTGLALGCDLLVKLDYTPHDNPDLNTLRYKPGDVVIVREDNAPIGRLEGPPLFWRIQIPGIEASVFREYLLPLTDGTSIVRRRQWQITTNTLPDMWHNKLVETGALIVRASPILDLPEFDAEWAAFETNILNHATGETETRRIVGIIRDARLR